MVTQFKTLFSPFRIGNLELKNRIVMPPMATHFAGEDGSINDRHIAYYVKRIKGGVGYMTSEHTGVMRQGRAFPNMTLIDSDQHIPHFKNLVEAIHREGGKIVIQINHAGRQTSSSFTGFPIVAPSAIPCPVRKEMPKELSQEEIQKIIEAFREAARRVKEAGADGVEIHMAHGYLINQFLSPFSNQRTDEYGGDPDRRMRMAVEVLRAVRNQVGSEFTVLCRLSADEYVEGGLKLEDTKEIAKALERNGADALHISACVAASGYLNHPPYYAEEGIFAHLAQGIKSVVSIPVIAVGRIRTPELANQILEENKADLISMGRALIADPNLPIKALQGKTEEIIPCISCNRCVLSIRKGALQCAVNPETGREALFIPKKTERPKKVWIIGGGPAGMKAAEISALRGHKVTLYEKDGTLGGRFLLAALPPKKQVLQDFTDYLTRKLRKLPVKIDLKKPFQLASLRRGKPDVVIIATGGKPLVPPIDGIRESKAVSVEDALSGSVSLGRKIFIIGGGGIGAEVADYLSENGKEVTLVEMLEGIALDLVAHLQYFLNKRLREKGVHILTSTKAVRFEKGGLWVEDPQGTRKLEGFDSIVLALGSTPDDEIVKSLGGKVPEVYVIGDASKPREVMEALVEGEEIALKI
jgi:2,4-dienoyl-CoA reductase-like NADH-dependent reductase (Old Yellow Enzyme family)/NADPH-dependent 2,4-dienoyl-CoA reductase/sulfur reductase-like enzyme